MNAYARVLLLAVLPAFVGVAGGEGAAVAAGAAVGPSFAPRQRTGVRAPRGGRATLYCRVHHLGDKAVSWVRSRDLQILSHGGAVFTADARVSVPPAPAAPAAPPEGVVTHALRIERLRDSDAGRYECQLNTEPKMSLFFDLDVSDEAESTEAATERESGGWDAGSVAVWAGAGEVRGVRGGTAELACSARGARPAHGAPPALLDIRWERGGRPLVLQEGWSVSRLAERAAAESRLLLAPLRAADAGAYKCRAGRAAATLLLRVDDAATEGVGEMEAMQRDQWAAAAAAAGAGVGAAGAGAAAAAAPHPLAPPAALLVLFSAALSL